ncbi:hypothetical protein [Escherichia coli]|uniref:hypothetical protein n=1 Tax=Escherichia coli TaxID=562 RepID=UPI000E015AEE|nr:hypothetical protein [Escherichia coli]STL59665.1 Uncharacterised protein [Escherichia coli]
MNNFAKFIISSTIGFFSLSAIAATGPSINSKTLSITLHSPANITANWVAESDLTPAKIMQPETLVGVISLSNTSMKQQLFEAPSLLMLASKVLLLLRMVAVTHLALPYQQITPMYPLKRELEKCY